MKFYTSLKITAFAVLSFLLVACKKDNNATETQGSGKVDLEFDHRVGTQSLQLNSQTYTNANGDDFKVTTFKYYVSNIAFIKADGTKASVSESYLLVNAADASSTIQTLSNVPAGDYTKIQFIIGVDEARNFAGAQTGALDPAKGMFWSWNSGYIFMMFEGTSSKSTQASNQLFYHVGGAKAPNNAVRTVTLDLPSVLRIRSDAKPEMHFYVDLAAMFTGRTTLSFAKLSGFHGGADAVTVADNYTMSMFSVNHIHN